MKSLLMMAALATSTCLLAPTLSYAQTAAGVQTTSESVAYGDLDLGTERGEARLAKRIDNAVRRVCGDEGARDLRMRAAYRACARGAKQQASNDIRLAVSGHGKKRRAA